MKRIILSVVSTGFLLGYAPFCPGTLATLLAFLSFLLLACFGLNGIIVTIPVAVIGFIIGLPLGNWFEKFFGKKDPREFVWDEVTGFFALAAVYGALSDDTERRFPAYVCIMAAGFVLFRILDIFKPLFINRLQDLPGGLGIMADDMTAGACGGLILAGMVFIFDRM